MTRHRDPAPVRSAVRFSEPPTTGYVHLAAHVGMTIGPTPLPYRSARTRQAISRTVALADGLAAHPKVTKATVYRAALVPPPGRAARRLTAVPADYDLAVLVEADDLSAVAEVQGSPAYQALRATLEEASRGSWLEMPARCLRLIADVDKDRQGLFLFNYFAGRDLAAALPVWEAMASWYAANTSLDNSTLLGPLTDTPYLFVNHARWDRSLVSFAAAQVARPTFRTEIRGRLDANELAAMPILYHLARRDHR